MCLGCNKCGMFKCCGEKCSCDVQQALPSAQVGYLRRGRYNKGKRVGKAVMLQAVRVFALWGADSQSLNM